jgi:Beta-propeller repeat
MRRTVGVFLLSTSLALAGLVAWHKPTERQASGTPASAAVQQPPSEARVLGALSKLPLSFEPNLGQTDRRVSYLARGTGYTAFLSASEATIRLEGVPAGLTRGRDPFSATATAATTKRTASAVVRIALAGANPASKAEGRDLLAGRSNYLIGNDPAKWHRNVPQFGALNYAAVYPGVDLRYHGNQSQLESDYLVAPGADAHQIGLRITGAKQVTLNRSGDLVLSTAAGELTLCHPRAFQELGNGMQEVAATYVQSGELVRIHVGAYDQRQTLIIDPVLAYSTYLGGTLNQILSGIAVDTSGFAYVTGSTSSTDFPTTTGVLQTSPKNSINTSFVTKLNSSGTGLVYSTLIGGSGAQGDSASAIAVDSLGDAYIVGTSSSTDFPTTSTTAYQTVNKGGGGFFAELAPTGASLVYSTYLSGSGTDRLQAVAVDVAGNVYITGATTSTDFPIVAGTAIQTTNNAATTQVGTALVSRIDPTKVGAGSLVYSTFIGGSKGESGLGVAVDGNANAYITGSTLSTDFPMHSSNTGFQTTLKNTSGGNAFVARIDTSQPNLLVYSTFLGGGANGSGSSPGEVGTGIALGPSGNAYMTGYSYATDYPLVGALDSVSNTPNQKAVVSRIDTTKSGVASLVYSTYFGGTKISLSGPGPGVDLGFGIAVDPAGNMYLAGTSRSVDFPVTPGAPQPAIVGTQNAFVAELNPSGSAVLFATFIGGSIEAANSIAIDHSTPANAYVAGVTAGNFPTTAGAFQTVDHVTGTNNNDGFVANLSPSAVTGVFATPIHLSFGTQTLNVASAPKTVTLFNDSSATITITGATISGTNAADFAETTTCGASLAVGGTCTYSIIFTPTISGAESATLSVTDSDPSSPQTVSLSGTGSGGGTQDFTLAVTPTSATVTAGGNTAFTVSLASVNSFTGTVSLTCTGAPAASSCMISPTSAALTANGTASSSGAINTTARSMVPPPVLLRYDKRGPLAYWIFLGIGLATLSAWVYSQRGMRRLVWGLTAIALLATASCSGVPHGGTPAGNYTLTITGTSGSLTHSATISLTVN